MDYFYLAIVSLASGFLSAWFCNSTEPGIFFMPGVTLGILLGAFLYKKSIFNLKTSILFFIASSLSYIIAFFTFLQLSNFSAPFGSYQSPAGLFIAGATGAFILSFSYFLIIRQFYLITILYLFLITALGALLVFPFTAQADFYWLFIVWQVGISLALFSCTKYLTNTDFKR